MAKKKKNRPESSATDADNKKKPTPQQRLDAIDQKLLKLIQQRATVCSKQGVVEPAAAMAGELASLERLEAASQGPLPSNVIRAAFRELLSGCRALQRQVRVAYLGPPYSYSHLAAITRFGSQLELIPVATIAAVFHELHESRVEYGIVPLENSTDGRVVDTLGMFTRIPVRICGEVPLQIHHNLLAKCARSEVTEVYSKPQALSQCREWLGKNLPQARTVETASTAAAAELAAKQRGAAAIASEQAGRHYQLDVIAANIEDNERNVTRFAVISDHTADRSGDDKTALMFEITHQPGALADTMAIFKRNRLNLTWIESFPIPGSPREYLFFVELQGHETDLKVRRAIKALRAKSVRLEILGSYPAPT